MSFEFVELRFGVPEGWIFLLVDEVQGAEIGEADSFLCLDIVRHRVSRFSRGIGDDHDDFYGVGERRGRAGMDEVVATFPRFVLWHGLDVMDSRSWPRR